MSTHVTYRLKDANGAVVDAWRRWFHPVFLGVLLAAMLVGFAPSFYLRLLFTDRPLPGYLQLHGVVLTSWFTLAFAQACLVAAKRVDRHRRLGWLAAANAVLVVPVSVFVAMRAIGRYEAAGVHPDESQFIVIGDLVSLAVFTALIGAALAMRRRPDWHRRLMAVACVIIIGPAIGRLERLGVAVPVPVALVGLLAAVIAHDVVTLRRVHRATVWGTLLVVVALAGVLGVVGTPAGQALIDALR